MSAPCTCPRIDGYRIRRTTCAQHGATDAEVMAEREAPPTPWTEADEEAVAEALHADACPCDPDDGDACTCGPYEREAGVVLAALALAVARIQRDARVEALREAADDMDDTDDPDAIYVNNGDIDLWLRARADRDEAEVAPALTRRDLDALIVALDRNTEALGRNTRALRQSGAAGIVAETGRQRDETPEVGTDKAPDVSGRETGAGRVWLATSLDNYSQDPEEDA